MTRTEQSPAHVEGLIEAHFAQRTTVDQERMFRSHMASCDRCRGHYERCLTVAQLDPHSVGAKDRLRFALGITRPATPKAPWLWAAGTVSACAAASLVLWFNVTSPVPGTAATATVPGFAERGGSLTAQGALAVFQVVKGDQLQPLAASARVTDSAELSVSYRTPMEHAFVMIFAVDAAQKVHWYVPAWHDANTAPAAKPVPPGHVESLYEAVTHPLAPGNVRMIALFLNRPADVLEVETAWAKGDRQFLGVDPTARLLVHNLTVSSSDAQ